MPTPFQPSVRMGVDERIAGGELVIDLDALKANYLALARASAPAVAAGVVKADAYGLGIDIVVPALVAAGCQRFFVAMPEEGFAVRRHAPEATIFVLTGLFSRDVAALYTEAELTPVLNSQRDVAIWEAHCGVIGRQAPCAVHVDTGMNRLGLTVAEALSLAAENSLTRALNIVLVMSHLACADEPEHPLNAAQLESFQRVREAFGEIESSLANSAGIFLGDAYRQSMTRPGIALYGGMPGLLPEPTAAPVVTLTARVVQVREVPAGQGVSYAATPLTRDSILAVVSLGYADGFLRAGSGAGVPVRDVRPLGGSGFLHGRQVPIIGRVTMDLTIFDVTDLGSGKVQPGDSIELIGPNMPIDQVAAAAGTITYEVLTALGSRFHRRVIGAA